MERTDLMKSNKDIIPIYGIDIIKLWGKNELTLRQFALDERLNVYEPGKATPISRDKLKKYPAKKIPYLIFDRQEIRELQEYTFSKLLPMDNLPYPIHGKLDKKKTDLFLKIRDLYDRKKLNPFDKAISKELENKKLLYFKKYKKVSFSFLSSQALSYSSHALGILNRPWLVG